MDSGISAKVIAHSIGVDGEELITLQGTAPKFLDAEFEKHRMISSGSSSDRAIPMAKMISRPYFLPVDIRLNEKGMQGYEQADSELASVFTQSLQVLYNDTCKMLSCFEDIHKQHLNRYLLGFSFQSKIMTATRDQWDAFNFLREAEGADPAIQDLAICIREATEQSVPIGLESGDWHTPYYQDGFWIKNKIEDGVAIDLYGLPLEVA